MGNGEMYERIECEAAALCLLLYPQRKHDESMLRVPGERSTVDVSGR